MARPVRQYDRVRVLSGPRKGQEGSAEERYGSSWRVHFRDHRAEHIPAADLESTWSMWD